MGKDRKGNRYFNYAWDLNHVYVHKETTAQVFRVGLLEFDRLVDSKVSGIFNDEKVLIHKIRLGELTYLISCIYLRYKVLYTRILNIYVI